MGRALRLDWVGGRALRLEGRGQSAAARGEGYIIKGMGGGGQKSNTGEIPLVIIKRKSMAKLIRIYHDFLKRFWSL